MSTLILFKKGDKGKNIKTLLTGIVFGLALSGCSSINYDVEEYQPLSKNTPQLCVQEGQNLKKIYSVQFINRINESAVSGRYYSSFNDDLIVNYNINSNSDYNMIEDIKNSSNDYSDIMISKLEGAENGTQGIDYMKSTYVFRFTHQGETISGIKFNDGTQDYDDFKANFSRYKILSKNFDLFVSMHELFHLDESMKDEMIGSTKEFFSDVSSVISISVENGYGYEIFEDFLDEVMYARRSDAKRKGFHGHYSYDLWSKIKSIMPKQDEYEDLRKIHAENNKNNVQEIIDNNSYDNGCYVIEKEKIKHTEKNISSFLKNKLKNEGLMTKSGHTP